MLGRTLGGASVSMMQGVIVFVLSLFLGFHPMSIVGAIIPIFLLMFLVAILFTALGTMIGSLLNDMQGFQLIMNFVIMPIFFLSGALFPIEGTSKVLGVIASLNPLSYGIDGLRGVLIGVSHFGLWTDVGVLSVVTLAFLALGSYMFSKIQI